MVWRAALPAHCFSFLKSRDLQSIQQPVFKQTWIHLIMHGSACLPAQHFHWLIMSKLASIHSSACVDVSAPSFKCPEGQPQANSLQTSTGCCMQTSGTSPQVPQNVMLTVIIEAHMPLASAPLIQPQHPQAINFWSQVEMSSALTMKARTTLPPSTSSDQDMDDDEDDDFFTKSLDEEHAAAEMMSEIMASNLDPQKGSIDVTIEPQKQLPGVCCPHWISRPRPCQQSEEQLLLACKASVLPRCRFSGGR